MTLVFSGASDGKVSACSAGDLSLIPGWGRAPWEGNGYPLQYSCLENFMDRSLAGYSPWGCKDSDMTERLILSPFFPPRMISLKKVLKTTCVMLGFKLSEIETPPLSDASVPLIHLAKLWVSMEPACRGKEVAWHAWWVTAACPGPLHARWPLSLDICIFLCVER